MRSTERGVSLVETMVGLFVSSVVMVGAMSVLTDVSSIDARHRAVALINQTYFQGVQVAQNARLFSDRNPAAVAALGYGDDLRRCLAHNPSHDNSSGTTFDCTTLDTFRTQPAGLPVSDAINDTLNASFTHVGRCANDQDPTCLVRRTTNYGWVCPARDHCSGLRLVVDASPLTGVPQGRGLAGLGNAAVTNALKSRHGDVFIPSRQIISKGEISFTCGQTRPGVQPNYAIYGIDFVRLSDRLAQPTNASGTGCATFDPGAACENPMSNYGHGTGNCVVRQARGCANGFARAGLFASQGHGVNGCE